MPRFNRQKYYCFFNDADTNEDGFLSRKELEGCLMDNGFKGSVSDINLMFHLTDLNGDNLISLDEFMICMGFKTGKAHAVEVVTKVFKRNDKRKAGKVKKDEYDKTMEQLQREFTVPEYARLTDMTDRKDDQDFDYGEFVKLVERLWERKEQLDVFWKKADRDKDGYLTLKELTLALKDEGYTKKDIEKKFKEMDTSGDGKISYEEYLIAMGEVPEHVHRGAFLRKVFHKIDTDKSGTINQKELQLACREFGRVFTDAQMKQIMDKADKDKSGELEYEEFVESIEEILSAQDAYEKFFVDADADGSGYLTVNELVAALRKGGYKGTDRQIKGMFNATDLSGDAKMTMDEYLIAMGRAPMGSHRTAFMRKVFHDFDKNGDGQIDKKEMEAVFKEMGRVMTDRELENLRKLMDKNKSGSLDYEDFIKLYEKVQTK